MRFGYPLGIWTHSLIVRRNTNVPAQHAPARQPPAQPPKQPTLLVDSRRDLASCTQTRDCWHWLEQQQVARDSAWPVVHSRRSSAAHPLPPHPRRTRHAPRKTLAWPRRANDTPSQFAPRKSTPRRLAPAASAPVLQWPTCTRQARATVINPRRRRRCQEGREKGGGRRGQGGCLPCHRPPRPPPPPRPRKWRPPCQPL